MNQEKFNLTWHTYTDHLREMLHNMMSSNELTDITLVSEDKKKFKAHKVVLSASSSVFKSIISDNLLTSQVIYLRGIQSFEIESILQFIYLGEATFYQERMNEFLDVARSLEVKEIEVPKTEQNDNFEKDDGHDNEVPKNEKIISRTPQKQRQIMKDNENKYPCNQCNYRAIRFGHLQQHIKSVHEGEKYPCGQCSYKASDPSGLRIHIQSIHEGVKYPCEQCNYQATKLVNLRRHIQSIHEE